MYIFRATGTFLFILLSNICSGQKVNKYFSLTGIIADASAQPLPGATVYLADLQKGAIADSLGRYLIENIPQGSYLVIAEHIGYHSLLQSVRFDKNIRLDFTLETAVTEQKEIVVTSALHATSIKRSPVPMTTVSREFFKQSLSSNVINAISSLPGVNAVSTGPNVSKPFIRGLGFTRVLTLFDGVRQEGQQWGDEHGVEIDENTVERVEVIKGPASLLYGSDAIGGVVNFIPSRMHPSGNKTGNAGLSYQTNNNLLEGTLGLNSHIKDINWQLTATRKIAADYQNKIDGRVYNTGFNESSLFFQTGLSRRWGNSRTGISYYDNKQEIPDGFRDSASRRFVKEDADGEWVLVSDRELKSYRISDVYQRIQHFRIYNASNFSLGKGRLGTLVAYQNNVRREFEEPGSAEAALFLNLNSLTYDFKYFIPQFGKWSITPGVNGMYQWNNSGKGYEFLIPDYQQFDAGPFLYVKRSTKKVEWAGGIRYDLRHFQNKELYVIESGEKSIPVYGADTTGADKLFSHYRHTYGGLSGSVGFTYLFSPKWNLKVNVARGYRTPNISEISSNGIHSGTRIYQLGNRDLKPEFSMQQDVEVAYDAEHVSFKASAFNNVIRNFIFNQKLETESGADSVIVPGFETFSYTASRANLYGGEIFVDIHPHPLDWLHFENSLSFVLAKNAGFKGQAISNEEKYLPFIPPVQGRSELRAQFNSRKTIKNFYAKVQVEWYADQNRVYSLNNTETPTPGYALVNIGTGADILNKKGNTVLAVTLMARNIMNTAYQSHLSRLKYFESFPNDPRKHKGIYDMGRNIAIKISVPFRLA